MSKKFNVVMYICCALVGTIKDSVRQNAQCINENFPFLSSLIPPWWWRQYILPNPYQITCSHIPELCILNVNPQHNTQWCQQFPGRWYNIVSILSDMLDNLEFKSWHRLEISLFSKRATLDRGQTHPPVKWVPAALSWMVKWQGYEADHNNSI
jgi:hypothetical protein